MLIIRRLLTAATVALWATDLHPADKSTEGVHSASPPKSGAASPPVEQKAQTTLCVSFDVGVPMSTRALVPSELMKFQDGLGVAFGFNCDAPSKVIIEVRYVPGPSHPETALGSIRVTNGTYLPFIEIFYKPIVVILPYRLPRVEAYAIALIVAHELSHWLRKQSFHDHNGLDNEGFGVGALLSPVKVSRKTARPKLKDRREEASNEER